MSNTWDDMKRTREEEFFHKKEEEQKTRLKEKLANPFSSFERGFSPLTGEALHKANVAGIDIINCPNEHTLMMSYHDLKTLLNAAKQPNALQVEGFLSFLEDDTA